MNNWRLFLIAVQFLTCIPVRLRDAPQAAETGRAALYYPLVGLLLGAVLALLNLALQNASEALRAALLLAVWVAMTGALHLDGLSDSADGALGGFGDARKTLEIMKDPRCGAVAVVALVLALLLKFAALQEPLWLQKPWLLAFVPTVGRIAPVLLFASTPYVSPGGLGSALAAHIPRGAVVLQAALGAGLCLLLLQSQGVVLLLACAILFIAWRRFWLRRIGGISGDIAGALVELTETAMLLALALSDGH